MASDHFPIVAVLAYMCSSYTHYYTAVLDVRWSVDTTGAVGDFSRRTISLSRLSPLLPRATRECSCVCTVAQLSRTTVRDGFPYHEGQGADSSILYQTAEPHYVAGTFTDLFPWKRWQYWSQVAQCSGTVQALWVQHIVGGVSRLW